MRCEPRESNAATGFPRERRGRSGRPASVRNCRHGHFRRARLRRCKRHGRHIEGQQALRDGARCRCVEGSVRSSVFALGLSEDVRLGSWGRRSRCRGRIALRQKTGERFAPPRLPGQGTAVGGGRLTGDEFRGCGARHGTGLLGRRESARAASSFGTSICKRRATRLYAQSAAAPKRVRRAGGVSCYSDPVKSDARRERIADLSLPRTKQRRRT